MPGWVTVGSAGEVGEGGIKAFEADGRQVAIANVGGALHAFDDLCTHKRCNLSHSELEGAEIECECHGGRFDVTTGRVLDGPPPEPLHLFQVREEGGDLQVDIG